MIRCSWLFPGIRAFCFELGTGERHANKPFKKAGLYAY